MIRKEIGDKKREASFYGNLGDVFAIAPEIWTILSKSNWHQKGNFNLDEDGEATDLDRANLGTFFLCVGQKAKAEKYYHEALTIFGKIGRKLRVADCYLNLSLLHSRF